MMNRQVNARIHWLSSQNGGRKEPPRGTTYSTVARFEARLDEWPNVAWSLVIEIDAFVRLDHTYTHKIWTLSPDAPADLLRGGDKFDLMEGNKVVAHGEIIG